MNSYLRVHIYVIEEETVSTSPSISLFTAILININIMVGAGIFINPPLMASIAGQFSYLGWLVGALIMVPLVISSARIATLCPGEGSLYRYSSEGLNKT